MASSNSPSPTVDPVSIWIRSQVLDSKEKPKAAANDFITRTDVAARYDGQRTVLWTSLSEMAGPNRQRFISRMVRHWPYSKERYAVIFPMQAGLISSCFCANLIAARINSDIFLYDAKTPFLESIRRCPKTPWVFSIYTTGLTYFAFYNLFFEKSILSEDEPCASCALSKYSALLIGAGVIFPAMTTPALAHYMHAKHNPEIPVVKNFLEFGTMVFVASKPTWNLLPKLAIFQLIVASLGTYSLLWGRNRIFNTVDIEPDVLTETMIEAQKEKSLKEKLNTLFSKISFLRPFLDDPTEATPKY